MTRGIDPAEPSVGELFHTLVDNGRDYVRAEVDVVRETALARVSYAKVAIGLAVGAIFILQAGLTVLFMALGSAIALWLGAWAGQLVSALVAFVLAGLMVKYAVSHFTPPSDAKPAEDRS